MKIKFCNNSVSGVNRKYRGFTLDIPGRATVIADVQDEYARDVFDYLKYRHPAVVFAEIPPELPESEPVGAADPEALHDEPGEQSDEHWGAAEVSVEVSSAAKVEDTVADLQETGTTKQKGRRK